MSRADTESLRRIENRERWVDCFPVHERLAHAHKDYVRYGFRRIDQLHLADLSGDLEHLEITGESHCPGRAEGALQRASGLRRDAKGESRAFRDRNGLDELAIVQPEQEFLGAVAGRL